MVNVFTPKATRVTRCILTEPKEWSILELSRATKLSYGYTHKVVQVLLKIGMCAKSESYGLMAKVRVADPSELLTRWANSHEYSLANKFNSYYSEERNVDRFVDKLSQIGEKGGLTYALTLHAGANLVTPFVRPTDVHFYMKADDIETWVRGLSLEPIEFGGNIHLVEPYDEGVFYGAQKRKGARVVSNVQLYVDLFNYPARGREAAEHLRRTAIKF